MIRRLAAPLFLALAATACGPTSPSVSAPASAAVVPPAFVLGCLSVNQAECEFVAELVLAELPDERGAPFSIQVQLFACPNDLPCPRSLLAREGIVTVEYADRGEPISRSIAGPPGEPRFGESAPTFVGLQEAVSERVAGGGPFPFELGHCGLSWQVDFDGSFWVPLGQVDGDASPIINSDRGQIRLLAPDLAEYRNADGFVAQLARFPGPKHVFGCD